ncbi:MAG: peptidoglycan-binding protein [Gammaproteobacteria bacterium]|nr:peptidoglycan-binding protein [Gammaproteobacteria bacterium]
MNKHILSTLVACSCLVLATTSNAQEDYTQTLPDAKPGECYAKVVTPAKFSTRTEELVVQEASERIETVPAKYETVDQTIVVKESSSVLKVIPAQYEESFDKVDTKAAEVSWSAKIGGKLQPASPGSLEGITRSGVELASVSPGTCFREYYTQPEYKTETRRVMIKEGSEKIVITPAQYETVEERVIVKEASTRVVDTPAVFRTETESVLVEPARSVWKKGRGPIERINNSTGEIMCLVEVPARYETITKTVLDKPASTKVVEIPAVYKTIKVNRLVKPAAETRQVVEPEFKDVTARIKVADAGFFWLRKGEKANSNATYSGREVCLLERAAETTTIKKLMVKKPASTQATQIPAQYQTVKVQRLVSPASERRVSIPARTKTVTRQVQTEPSRLEWRKVLCETNMTPKIVTSIQRALKREGFDPGPIDGVVGQGTLDAIEEFQLKNSMDRGGLTYETLKALKVDS